MNSNSMNISELFAWYLEYKNIQFRCDESDSYSQFAPNYGDDAELGYWMERNGKVVQITEQEFQHLLDLHTGFTISACEDEGIDVTAKLSTGAVRSDIAGDGDIAIVDDKRVRAWLIKNAEVYVYKRDLDIMREAHSNI